MTRFQPPDREPLESGLRELVPAPPHGDGSPVEYLTTDPGESGEIYQDEPPCPRCRRGFLVREFVPGGEMLTCAGGCGARFWLDRPR